ncbi:uncharacterized protein TM35_000023480 [Trypanosoma theileri]|uniref:Uncharacterized protein n=1 Tax=Trypanosoma theileri TaxID=67003 RepID=A0A1X0P7W3_9TRYP|nr:uncharacterized protein TM35_000023480 [Trypanosoma theileri]ORC93022.1 hypothetical protein TM35_000023480 [Trypanosoma theileri]
MPRKAVKKRKRSSSSESKNSSSSDDHGKRGGALSKFEEFDVAEVLQKSKEVTETPPPPQQQQQQQSTEEPQTTLTLEPSDINTNPAVVDTTTVVTATAASVEAILTPAPPVELEPPMPIPQLIPPEPMTELSPDEVFVPLPTLQVVPMMNRSTEAQSGLLKEPTPPANIQRVTQPNVPAPAMPTALMELLSG